MLLGLASVINYACRRRHSLERHLLMLLESGNIKGGSIPVPLSSCLTGLDQSVLQIKTKIVSCHTSDSKPVKQEVNGKVILTPLVFPARVIIYDRNMSIIQAIGLVCLPLVIFVYFIKFANSHYGSHEYHFMTFLM